jgi:hypothetical protein
MALAFEVVQFEFIGENFKQGSGQKELISTPVFGGHVQNATAALQSFDLRYQRSDHHVLQETVWLDASVSAAGVVTVTCRILLRDGSGNIDDPFTGSVNVVVIADVV